MDKRSLSERDICTKIITPALSKSGWDESTQIREEASFTKGHIFVRGKLVSRGKGKRANYILSVKPNIPIAIIEAKENSLPVAAGMKQGLTAQSNIGLADVNDFPIPLPPLAEQHRIVAKVDALTAICDQLEASLTTTRSRLLEALFE